MNFSFWEYESWINNIDYCIVGSGITGLNCALEIRKKQPSAKILILEKGILPEGASTKNAGFACFGSISEILDDLKTLSEEEVITLIQKRWDGLNLLRKNLGDRQIDFQQNGGYELFTEADSALYEQSMSAISSVNKLLTPVFGESVFSETSNNFRFSNIKPRLIYNRFEGQIDTGRMMQMLLKKVHTENIRILNGMEVISFTDGNSAVEVITNQFKFSVKKLIIATNGFASRLGLEEVKPARAQVLITKPIENLHLQGTFHLDRGYFYFRNIDNRILFGGGRNLDFTGEETDITGTTSLIQNKLRALLKSCILPDTAFEIDRQWSGIMGVGATRQPVIKAISSNVFCGVRLGGMGIAIGSLVGRDLANLTLNS
ncbi:NAD(P)/FAD-dependent oxidoreductase [Christiangramia portivictoriae]|uniref:NAD(P)/FAD-dependent oxidoreductase n=1 Tax=Christiangramia portivictoriae TaxID=326069 RepID=UPI000400BB56|nr:FAD-dependent oxidoreductase [Christiangramia portivictoriae]